MHVLLSFDWHLLQQRLVEPGSQYWLALSATVAIAIVAMVMGIVLGFIAWAGTRSSFRPSEKSPPTDGIRPETVASSTSQPAKHWRGDWTSPIP